MSALVLTVKKADDASLDLSVDAELSVKELKAAIERKTRVPAGEQRLIFLGRVLHDESAQLRKVGMHPPTASVHLVRVEAGSGKSKPPANAAHDASSFGSLSGPLGAFQQHLLENPQVLQGMMNSPSMQALLNDGDLLRRVMELNPQMRKWMSADQSVRAMVNDKTFLAEAQEAFRNPSAMYELLSSTSKALSAVDGVAAGMATVRSLHAQLERFHDQARAITTLALQEGRTDNLRPGEPLENGPVGPDGDPLMPPPVERSFDSNAMAAMLQDPNMAQLLAQIAATSKAPVASPGPEDNPYGIEGPFANPATYSQLFNPATMQAMATMEGAVTSLGGKSSDFVESFQTFLQAQAENPELLYRTQLAAMRTMGFRNVEQCIAALRATGGNMTKAIDRLLAEEV